VCSAQGLAHNPQPGDIHPFQETNSLEVPTTPMGIPSISLHKEGTSKDQTALLRPRIGALGLEVASDFNNGHEIRPSDVTESRDTHSLFRVTYASRLPEIVVNKQLRALRILIPSRFDIRRGQTTYGVAQKRGAPCTKGHMIALGHFKKRCSIPPVRTKPQPTPFGNGRSHLRGRGSHGSARRG
jgi:hypothetical protein